MEHSKVNQGNSEYFFGKMVFISDWKQIETCCKVQMKVKSFL